MTRKSKPKRSCGLCKPHKRWGNSRQRDKPAVVRAKRGEDRHGRPER